MKNHENQPGTMKNQPGTMKNQPGTVKPTSRTQLEKVIIFRDKHTAPIIYRLSLLSKLSSGLVIISSQLHNALTVALICSSTYCDNRYCCFQSRPIHFLPWNFPKRNIIYMLQLFTLIASNLLTGTW